MTTEPKSSSLKKISKLVLLSLTRLVLKKYKPLVIGVTGSLGKTTTTQFSAALLGKTLDVVKTEYDFATTLTTPLTLLRLRKPKRTKNIFWFLPIYVIRTLPRLLVKKDYPQCFVLELRSDVRAGQSMKELIKALQPQVGVITAIQPVHLTYFKTVKRVARAKRVLIESLPKQGLALLNYDDPLVREMAPYSQAPVIFYGLTAQSQIKADQVNLGPAGLSLNVHYQNKVIPLRATHLINQVYLYPLLVGTALALIYGRLSVKEISRTVSQFRPIQGRGNPVKGIKGTTLINDAFNATPHSVMAALDSLIAIFPAGKKIVVLGDMLQMGKLTAKGHCQVGQKVAQIKPDILITVGPDSRLIAQEAIKLGFPQKRVSQTADFKEATILLKKIIRGGEAILFKASHGIKLYKIIEKLQVKQP